MDSPFALSSSELIKERRALLETEGIIHQVPYVEAMPSFVSSGKTLKSACSNIGWATDFAEFANKGLFDESFRMHQHQFEAFRRVLESKRNVVVTSGTGSGKTESFLLPLIASILDESIGWSQPSAKADPWWEIGSSWKGERNNERRPAAIRGLILYPLNALVEDQLTRLRKALDSDDAREWLDDHRHGNRIYFGRYTGKTPVSGRQNSQKRRKMRSIMLNMKDTEEGLRTRYADLKEGLHDTVDTGEIDSELASKINKALGEELLEKGQTMTNAQASELSKRLDSQLDENLSFIPQTSGAEMVSRWDMQETPPDIFITNFSMLNIILTRMIEQNIFEQTKAWLAEDSSHTFFLVLDELHTYRGTAGTEVSYVLRALLHRLGLSPDSPQLRIIATSASLDETGKQFLEDFFGVSAEQFDVLAGERETADKYHNRNTYQDHAPAFEDFYNRATQSTHIDTALEQLCKDLDLYSSEPNLYQKTFDALNQSGAIHAFVKQCDRPRSILDLAEQMFHSRNPSAVAGFLSALGEARDKGQVAVPLRGHLFFRNFQGLWACSNPHCDAVEPKYRFEGRTIGKLYTQPQVACSCGGRVLDFYYCQNCGDAFLGGYKTVNDSEEDTFVLSADFPELEQLPDKMPATKKYADYAVYWPGMQIHSDTAEWKRNGGAVRFSWEKASFNPFFGSIRTDALRNPTGHWFQIHGQDTDKIPAFPTRCCGCGDDWEIHLPGVPIESTVRTRSPIRGQRTGFDKVSQVLIDSLMREFTGSDNSKIVLFSDSRQDAAKLSVKFEQGHYLDLLRRVVSSAAHEDRAPVLSWIKLVRGEPLDEQEQRLAEQYRLSSSTYRLARDIEDYFKGYLPDEVRQDVDNLVRQVSLPPSLRELWDKIERRIVNLGMNPGGPYKSLQNFKAGQSLHSWTDLYTFNHSSIVPAPETVDERQHHNELKKSLQEKIVADTLFSQRKRDFESLALGTMITDPDMSVEDALGKSSDFWRGLFDSSVRILGANRRYSGGRKAPSDFAPKVLKDYWSAVSRKHSLDESAILSTMESMFRRSSGIQQYIIQIDKIHIVPYDEGTPVYACVKCHRVHLHPSCDVCTDCFSELVQKQLKSSDVNDYYRSLADDIRTETRIHTEELTGQTDAEEASRRQKLFQGIFDDSDIPLVDEIDVLSVTTTMEAGIDIGSLKIVAMSNMPPQRFNYQQRVGRCGRRGTPLSVSLTMCRGRSHDDWYFDNLDRITGDPPPQPYIDVNSVKVFKRVLVKEILYHAYRATGLENEVQEGLSVHGDFGRREDWSTYKERIQKYLQSQEGMQFAKEVITALSFRVHLSVHDQQALFAYVTNGEVAGEISQISNDIRYSHIVPLSECLATAGLLPMFGFPTRLRLLHHQPRTERSFVGALEKGTVDRDLEIAIGEYAPGSEVVKEKAKHRAVGVAHYTPLGSKIEAEPEPLGQLRTIALCKHCQILYDGAPDSLPDRCPSCGASKMSNGVFRHIPISEPMGFRSDWNEQDFTEEFEWVSRGSSPRLAQKPPSAVTQVFNTQFYSQEGDIYTLNDNTGELFTFYKAKNPFDGWIEKNSVGVNGFNPALTSTSVDTALASIKNTEVLVLTPATLQPGMTFNPAILGVRAALYSFGFLFRRIASDLLDVDADELQVGFRSVVSSGNTVGQIFLADRLINGAGYSRYLGQPEVLSKLLSDLSGPLMGAPNLKHHDCDSSCYECLRTYENMSYHGLLDWRLAFDVANVLTDPTFVPGIGERWGGLVRRSAKGMVSNYPGMQEKWFGQVPAVIFPGENIVALFGHPLWNIHEDFLNEPMSEATVTAELEFPAAKVIRYNIFDLIRRPVWIINDILSQEYAQ
ncbi:DEAD/DEAH box helicase [Alicyclobacillus sp. SO9]|uniref:DEAD/DEAH box helicase n=1 Tax=Alicyclobacillus sp. SO9 TaxID=2665646 RepID=UPI001E2BABBE|nr:DEAD/DEAH box helicase [Alicyclobacillus sp. SO9]